MGRSESSTAPYIRKNDLIRYSSLHIEHGETIPVTVSLIDEQNDVHHGTGRTLPDALEALAKNLRDELDTGASCG